MRIATSIILAASLMIAFPACGSGKVKKTQEPATVKVEPARDFSARVPGEWTIAKVDGKQVKGDERPYITFDPANSRFYGSNGCNTVNGDYKLLPDNKIRMTNIIATMRMCHDAPFEFKINSALDKARTYSIKDVGNESYMTLYNDRGNAILVLRKHNMDFLNGAWQVTKINGNEVDIERYPELQLMLDIPELRVHGNTGCNILNGSLLIDPDKTDALQFVDMALTMRLCPDAAMETEMVLALESVEKAIPSADNNQEVILYDQHDQPIVTLRRINLVND